ncbi:YHYH protein [Zobellia amurskyensis]|uniref:YHYH protein n=1 Tax=Zobellia amurskyensis TaxID=248905 RepID=A0A7X2ZSR1_9FLAO|nr:YHYH protein [Zobellia amurskyensis]MUH35694.1 YHYH protein [Zobellia amurskyensis]
MKQILAYAFWGIFILSSGNSCSSDESSSLEEGEATNEETTGTVDPTLFLADGLVEPITTVEKTLSDGTVAMCYKITTTSTPSEHQMGPWCPTNISDGADKGGKWFENGELYDVDGAFIENMADFYSDATWKMYDENGDIYVTNSLEDCQNAANPNVGEEYENFCVECQPSYVTDITLTYYIPVTPVKLDAPDYISDGAPGGGAPPTDGPPAGGPPEDGGGEGSVIGLAFNGVNFDPPAPTSAILGAYTLAPMDDNGGHVNPNTGYHYHAATGMSSSVAQEDGHSAMIGYAIDGFPMFERLDEEGNEPSDLDDCRGHTDETRGYHYHVAAAGTNSFIGCFAGAQGSFEIN